MAQTAKAAGHNHLQTEVRQKIRVVIASPVHLVRDSLAAMLRDRDDVAVINTVGFGPEAIAEITDVPFEVVLVDLGHTEPRAAASAFKGIRPGAKLVAFALHETDDQVFACAAAGFSGYVARESNADELYRVLIDTVEGRMHCAPHITAAMFTRLAGLLRQHDREEGLPELSSREHQILALAERGHSNKEIARQLAISAATVKNHMHNILQKLQVARRGQAAARLRQSLAA